MTSRTQKIGFGAFAGVVLLVFYFPLLSVALASLSKKRYFSLPDRELHAQVVLRCDPLGGHLRVRHHLAEDRRAHDRLLARHRALRRAGLRPVSVARAQIVSTPRAAPAVLPTNRARARAAHVVQLSRRHHELDDRRRRAHRVDRAHRHAHHRDPGVQPRSLARRSLTRSRRYALANAPHGDAAALGQSLFSAGCFSFLLSWGQLRPLALHDRRRRRAARVATRAWSSATSRSFRPSARSPSSEPSPWPSCSILFLQWRSRRHKTTAPAA